MLHVPRFTSGAKPANLLVASHSLPHTCQQALVGLKTAIYHATAVRQTLYRLSYADSAYEHTKLYNLATDINFRQSIPLLVCCVKRIQPDHPPVVCTSTSNTKTLVFIIYKVIQMTMTNETQTQTLV